MLQNIILAKFELIVKLTNTKFKSLKNELKYNGVGKKLL